VSQADTFNAIQILSQETTMRKRVRKWKCTVLAVSSLRS